jgi:hypothetical protein
MVIMQFQCLHSRSPLAGIIGLDHKGELLSSAIHCPSCSRMLVEMAIAIVYTSHSSRRSKFGDNTHSCRGGPLEAGHSLVNHKKVPLDL